MMQSFFICCLITVDLDGRRLQPRLHQRQRLYRRPQSRFFLNGLGANWDKPFTLGLGSDNAQPQTVPESVYMMFQMTFAIITPALIAGAFADRMKFSAMIVFMVLWSLLVYSPIAHWVWSPTRLARRRRVRPAGCGGLRRRHRGAYQRRASPAWCAAS